MSGEEYEVAVIGGGPAGLAAAYQLTENRIEPMIFEREGYVGGISRTVEYMGYRFDLGGHRFFTKTQKVWDMWTEVIGDEFLVRDRLSRIYYKRRFFHYPLKLTNVIWNLGPLESLRIFLSYLRAKALPLSREDSFEEYIVNRFGRRLYSIFFKSYTEKVWGIPCENIRSQWAAQRIKGMSFLSVLKTLIFGNRGNIRSMIERFHYPKYGPGQMWDRMKDVIDERGGRVDLDSEVISLEVDGDKVASIEVRTNQSVRRIKVRHLISTIPLRDLVLMIKPAPPDEVTEAARKLRYRDFITVGLIVDKEDMWPDNWLYIHDRELLVGRIQNFKNWSPYMVPDKKKTCIGMEYFAFEGDDLWNMRDEELVRLGSMELSELALIDNPSLIEDGKVIRVRKTYPIYDMDYEKNISTIRGYLKTLVNLETIGRNGMHRYNNMDHSMLTGIMAAENIVGCEHDVWSVNAEQEYHETQERRGR